MMRKFYLLALGLCFVALGTNATAQQQQRPSAPATTTTTPTVAVQNSGSMSAAEVNRIVHAFSAKETEFQQALTQYVFKREVTVQTVGFGGQVSGEYRRDSSFTLSGSGERSEKILYFPMPTLTELSLTAEDLEDFGGVNAFALEAKKINFYNFTYAGKERIDDLDLFVFDVAPKTLPDPKRISERFFQGRIWVDAQDLQIVKTRGKGVPEGKQRFPIVETYREQIDGRFWFPTYAYVDDQLVFDGGQVVHMRMKIKYTEYQLPKGRLVIIEDDGDAPAPPAATTNPQTPTQTAPRPQPSPQKKP